MKQPTHTPGSPETPRRPPASANRPPRRTPAGTAPGPAAPSTSGRGTPPGDGNDPARQTEDPAAPDPGTRRRSGRRALLLALGLVLMLGVGTFSVISFSSHSSNVRMEGESPARKAAPASSPSVKPQAMHDVDPVKLLTSESSVPAAIKADLRECGGSDPKIALTEYGDLTKDGTVDALISVRSCTRGTDADAGIDSGTGTGVFAFAHRNGRTEMVFDLAVSGISGRIVDGDIRVVRSPLPVGDEEKSDTSVDEVRYSWNGQNFQPLARAARSGEPSPEDDGEQTYPQSGEDRSGEGSVEEQ
jgi:hypothetical protein